MSVTAKKTHVSLETIRVAGSACTLLRHLILGERLPHLQVEEAPVDPYGVVSTLPVAQGMHLTVAVGGGANHIQRLLEHYSK